MLRLIPLVIVIDQIDAGTALVEWEVGVFTEVSTACLPQGVREGDRLRVRRPRDSTPCSVRVVGGSSSRRRRLGMPRFVDWIGWRTSP